ncbi:MAG: NAD(P)/FAD-dependent oxidoreductase [Polyangia bacterium]|jgi:thioredoxin reductase (NADPH)
MQTNNTDPMVETEGEAYQASEGEPSVAAEGVPYDVAIVGGGPAGLVAATHCRMRGLSSITFEAQAFGGQLVSLYPSKPVTNFPANLDVASGELARRLAEQAAHFGAELHEHEAVESVGYAADVGFVLRSTGQRAKARAVLLALGLGRFRPRKLGLKEESCFAGRGLFYRLPSRDNIVARHAVVVGGGDTAVDMAIALKAIVPDVTLVHRHVTLRAYPHSLERLDASGVQVMPDAEVVGLRGSDVLEHVLVALHDQEAQEIPADLLLVSVGQVPDLGGLAEWDLKLALDGSHLPVDSSMRTAVYGVFAAGDFVAYPGKIKMIATAVAEGSTAAASVERYLRLQA